MNFRKRGKKWIALLLAVALVTTSFGVVPASYGAADKEGPKVDLDSIKLSKQKITNRKEAPTVKIKVTDNTGVHSVCLFYEIPGKWHNSGPAHAFLEYDKDYNKATGYFEGTINYSCAPIGGDVYTRIGYYGKHRLKQITAVDFYGNETVLTDLDVPQANFEVVGGNPEDQEAPVIDFDNIVLEKVVKKGETGKITIPIADDSEVVYLDVYGFSKTGGILSVDKLKKVKDGIYQGEMTFQEPGEYHFYGFNVTDANFNTVEIRNSDYFGNDGYTDENYRALGFLNVQYGDLPPTELTASIKSIEYGDIVMERMARETVTISFDSSAPLEKIHVCYGSSEGNSNIGGEIQYYSEKVDDSTFRFHLPTVFYGTYELWYIEAVDIYGCQKVFYDPVRKQHFEDYIDLSNGNGVEMDFACGDYDYYVSIVDEETGLGVSDSKIDENTDLIVEEGEMEGSLFEDLEEEDGIGIAIYDVEVEGNRDEETVASFVAPEGMLDGDKVTIVHKRHDGTNETFDTEVKHGRITIETDEFSPFLVQIDKNHKHRYDVEGKVVKKATTTKDGQIQLKCVCGAVGTKAKAIPKASKVSLFTADKAYTGKTLKAPSVVVKDSKGKTIAKENYEITKPSKTLKNVGKYTYTVTFKGQYSGSKKLTFTIKPKKTSVTKLTAAKKAFTVKLSKVSSQATGYEIMYATNSKFTKGKKTVTIKSYKTTSKQISKLSAKKTYYVKVRTYKTVSGKKIYSDWSGYKKVKTK